MTTTASLFNSPVVRYGAALGIPFLCSSVNAHAALVAATASAIPLVRGVQGMSDQIQLLAWPVALIGGTVTAMSLWNARGNWHELGHGATNIVGVGALSLGTGSLLALIPGVQGALI